MTKKPQKRNNSNLFRSLIEWHKKRREKKRREREARKKNIIREYVTIHSSTSKDGATSIGDDNFFMAFSHIAHDCHIANKVVLCNGALLAGHARVDEGAFISGNVVVHQFVKI